jgi:hypothetical protein
VFAYCFFPLVFQRPFGYCGIAVVAFDYFFHLKYIELIFFIFIFIFYIKII